MNLSIFFLILFAAFLHAGWNIIIKSLNNSLVAMGVMVFFQSLIFVPVVFYSIISDTLPMPSGITWFYILGSVFLHNIYFITLGKSYNKGDLNFIYPVSRGCAPVFVTILSIIFLKENISNVGIVGILIVSSGLLFLSVENYKKKVNLNILRTSVFIALIISFYTFCDGAGVRSVNNSFTYIIWLFFLEGWVTLGYVYIVQKDEIFKIKKKELTLICIGSLMSFSAYSITIWAMKHVQIGYVASIRESGIIMAILISALVLKAKVTWIKYVASSIIFAGVYLIYNS